jgi:hypothetical protein
MEPELETILLETLVSLLEALLAFMTEVFQVLDPMKLLEVDQEARLVRGHSLELLVLEVRLPHLTATQHLLVEQKISVLRE